MLVQPTSPSAYPNTLCLLVETEKDLNPMPHSLALEISDPLHPVLSVDDHLREEIAEAGTAEL